MGRKRSQSTEAVWRDRLARFNNCKLTVKEFCRQEGVSDPSFYQWRKRLDKVQQGSKRVRRSGSGPTKTVKPQPFMPVKVSSWGDAPSLALAEVEFPNGIRIRVPATYAEALRIAILTGNEVCREVG
ncbi:MAG: transposase [Pirellulaceae bacterium]|jgi:transposase-like protein|nr:transposase [Pirellulaceae bacterium]|tara:strand:+ start:127 stop:507 length:381 start_codon:yes stop_codon:yes gene_type:complete